MCLTIRYWARCGRVVDGVLCENQSSNGTNTEDVPEPCEDFKARNGGKAVFGSPHCPNHELRHAPKQGVPCKHVKGCWTTPRKERRMRRRERTSRTGIQKPSLVPLAPLRPLPRPRGAQSRALTLLRHRLRSAAGMTIHRLRVEGRGRER
ncbi:hypothetical protein BDY17DRAFT_300462 [Neohortaea acidophila]|uniref:Uncharacterized protein n=1 Tax=Neohortaea acidophila TaxID=245834 RepID=A0A6A6PQX4_9PEZI|nr:uncharacterized protein BDY17DRAFT_300462 [Neohortaea acidophila]KAF2482196.1 hypothetical protein BDY17DRAFT_300462 [Neohortaea acidophila]